MPPITGMGAICNQHRIHRCMAPGLETMKGVTDGKDRRGMVYVEMLDALGIQEWQRDQGRER